MAMLPLPPGFVEQAHQYETWWLKAGYESLVPAAIRQLAEPWLEDLDNLLAGRPNTVH